MNPSNRYEIRIERLNGGQPIIRKVEGHPWENHVTFNPASALVTNKNEIASIVSKLPFSVETKDALFAQPALCFLLYRAQGEKSPKFDYAQSTMGLAVLSPQLRLLARHTEPVLKPEEDYENLGVEDGRITKIGDTYVLLYTAYSKGEPENQIRIGMASSRDFVTWKKHGLLRGEFNQISNKNGMIFQEKIGGKYVMFHRPLEGKDAFAIHWAETDDVYGTWKSRGLFMKPVPNPAFPYIRVGGGAPPMRLSDNRFLILYHIGNRKTDGTLEYDLGIVIGDPGQKGFIVKRHEPILRPETPVEKIGDPVLGVNNVVFVCGAHLHNGDLYFSYGGADSVVLGGKISRTELERFVTE
jgi:beta-1,2-mannobiose phosphorylase / 1,2-beta-oligomannan phosphorylase